MGLQVFSRREKAKKRVTTGMSIPKDRCSRLIPLPAGTADGGQEAMTRKAPVANRAFQGCSQREREIEKPSNIQTAAKLLRSKPHSVAGLYRTHYADFSGWEE